jgi:hypothetical protein
MALYYVESKAAASVFDCVTVGSQSHLRADLSIQCWCVMALRNAALRCSAGVLLIHALVPTPGAATTSSWSPALFSTSSCTPSVCRCCSWPTTADGRCSPPSWTASAGAPGPARALMSRPARPSAPQRVLCVQVAPGGAVRRCAQVVGDGVCPPSPAGQRRVCTVAASLDASAGALPRAQVFLVVTAFTNNPPVRSLLLFAVMVRTPAPPRVQGARHAARARLEPCAQFVSWRQHARESPFSDAELNKLQVHPRLGPRRARARRQHQPCRA